MAHFNAVYSGRVKATLAFLLQGIDETARNLAIATRATGPNPDRLALEIELARSLPSSDLTVFDWSILSGSAYFGVIAGLIWKRPRSGSRPKDIE